ncbi:Homeodomain-like DNA binding domain-containing transcription factor [Mucor lusitanicus CBS 277.49]|uniref:Homeodomain-like DNA binding domain-containing transcription factor n=1 Tax=Mucor lusitanicus CBS 277.49 TaxID=747725 RepID=A0A162YYA0_MUCCL|nr:Homeodomain-like DNA binding domain-containing transcription factor [Mucor lusitanicus CBS 277.49]
MDLDEEIIDIGSDEEEQESQRLAVSEQPPSSIQQAESTAQDSWTTPAPAPAPPASDNLDMDDESRKLIEQMLAEEEYFYGRDTISTLKQQSAPKKKRKSPIKDQDYDFEHDTSASTTSTLAKKSRKEGAILSSASLPSHKTRWNEEEDDLLKEALVKHGYGNWRLISEHVKTRNPLQCKNHARHLQQYDKIDSSLLQPPSPAPPQQQRTPEMEEIKAEQKEEASLLSEDDFSIESDEEEPSEPVKEEQPDIPKRLETPTAPADSPTPTTTTPPTASDQDEIKNDTQAAPTAPRIHQSEGIQFSPFEISEQEMAHNPEWFRQKYSKTPDRYLKIRNHMLACWKLVKPKYLTKTSARKGLKDCGDVNAIGRVHEYLESIGAINVDCVTSAPRPPRRVPRESNGQVDDDDEELLFDAMEDASGNVVGYDGPRKRKVRNEAGEWVDPKELEGRVIEHGQVVVRLDSKPKRTVKRLSHHYYGGDDFGRGYDPFRLVPTEHYTEDNPAPFELEISSDCLLVMDFHSHLAHTEIIGLLGGNFITRGESKILQVKVVFPCQSTSTGIQCEMDPASEMQAREVFAEKGLNVVGWYHSHPTFEPHPSIRDIENQTSEEKTGDEPFIGVIVTPYDPEIQSENSQIQYLHISKEWNSLHSFRVPFACRRTVIQSEQVSVDIMDQLLRLIQEYKDYEHKVNMMLPFGSQSRLDKLLDSLRAHIFMSSENENAFILKVKEAVYNDFVDKAHKLEATRDDGHNKDD